MKLKITKPVRVNALSGTVEVDVMEIIGILVVLLVRQGKDRSRQDGPAVVFIGRDLF